MGGYTFLRWPLYLLLNRASGFSMGEKVPRKRDATHAASRFLAAIIAAWFSLDILNYKAMTKVDRKSLKQAARIQQDDVTKCPGRTLQTAQNPDSKVCHTSPPVLAGKTMDLTLLAVTRALDSLIVNLYRRSHPSSPDAASASSTLTAISRYADAFIFALSSGTVVCLHFGTIPSLTCANCRWYRQY